MGGTRMKPSEVLDKAADIIERDGWIQGAYYREVDRGADLSTWNLDDDDANRTAPCCQAGGVARAVCGWAWPGGHGGGKRRRTPEGSVLIHKATGYMNRYVAALTGDDAMTGVSYNDAPGRTAGEMTTALRAAAGQARAAGE